MKKICHIGFVIFKVVFLGAFLLWLAVTNVIGAMVDIISRG